MPGFLALALACAPFVAPTTMAALVRAESGFHPLTIGVNNGAPLGREPQSPGEAKTLARTLLARGFNLDLGLAQINSANLSRLGLSLDTVFDPCRNLHAAAVFLSACYERASGRYGQGQRALQAALSCYNTNSLSRGFANGYVQKVVAASRQFVPAIDPQYPVPVSSSLPRRRGGVVLEPAPLPAAAAPPARLITPLRAGRGGITVIRGGGS